MGLFKKKPKILGPVPLSEIQSLRNAGLSDKDIIKKLKEKGYDYKEIERAMLQSLKTQVSQPSKPTEEEKTQEPFSGASSFQEELPTFDDFLKSSLPTSPVKEFKEEDLLSFGEQPIQEETVSPEVTIEEIVEGIMEEKWQPMHKELEAIMNEQEKIKKEITEIKALISKIPGEETKSNIFIKVQEIEEKLNEIEPKVNGLEKAFKQFLPTLTENIRMLSNLVERLKEKSKEQEERYSFRPPV
jgi:DNA-binding transcriptional MerR regulator